LNFPLNTGIFARLLNPLYLPHTLYRTTGGCVGCVGGCGSISGFGPGISLVLKVTDGIGA